MRLFSLLFFISFSVCLFAVSSAQAEPKPWVWSWWEGHWQDQDFQPHYENGKHPHNTQWDDKAWLPQDWSSQRQSSTDLVKGFYRAGILSKQYMSGDVPVLEVGPNFYHLSGLDKRRVVQTVDDVFGGTEKDPYMFYLKDWKTGEVLGLYTKSSGLQLQ